MWKPTRLPEEKYTFNRPHCHMNGSIWTTCRPFASTPVPLDGPFTLNHVNDGSSNDPAGALTVPSWRIHREKPSAGKIIESDFHSRPLQCVGDHHGGLDNSIRPGTAPVLAGTPHLRPARPGVQLLTAAEHPG